MCEGLGWEFPSLSRKSAFIHGSHHWVPEASAATDPSLGVSQDQSYVTCRCGLGPPQISVPFPEISINYQPQMSSLADSLFLLKTLAKAFLKGALRFDLFTPFDSLNVQSSWL